MRELITEIIICAPRATVWSVLTNFSAYTDWNPFIISSAGQATVGTQLVNKMQQGEKTFTFKPKVTAVVEAEHLEWLGHLFIPGLFDGRHYFRLEEVDAHTTKLIHGEYFSGLLSGIILKRIEDDTRHGYILMNRALKQRAEQQVNLPAT